MRNNDNSQLKRAELYILDVAVLGETERTIQFNLDLCETSFANCSCGCQNNLLKLCDQIDFELGGPDDPLYEDLTDEQIETMVVAMKYEKKMQRIKERRSRR